MTDDTCNHTRLTSIVTSSIELCTGIIGIKITDSYLVSQHTPIYLYDGSFCVLKLFYCWIGGGCCLVVNYFGSNILMGVETKMVSENLRNANSMQIPQYRYYVSYCTVLLPLKGCSKKYFIRSIIWAIVHIR